MYALSLHDALPICEFVEDITPALGSIECGVNNGKTRHHADVFELPQPGAIVVAEVLDRKSTRLNSSHSSISYAVFCLNKKTRCPTSWRCACWPSPECTRSAHLTTLRSSLMISSRTP